MENQEQEIQPQWNASWFINTWLLIYTDIQISKFVSLVSSFLIRIYVFSNNFLKIKTTPHIKQESRFFNSQSISAIQRRLFLYPVNQYNFFLFQWQYPANYNFSWWIFSLLERHFLQASDWPTGTAIFLSNPKHYLFQKKNHYYRLKVPNSREWRKLRQQSQNSSPQWR